MLVYSNNGWRIVKDLLVIAISRFGMILLIAMIILPSFKRRLWTCVIDLFLNFFMFCYVYQVHYLTICSDSMMMVLFLLKEMIYEKTVFQSWWNIPNTRCSANSLFEEHCQAPQDYNRWLYLLRRPVWCASFWKICNLNYAWSDILSCMCMIYITLIRKNDLMLCGWLYYVKETQYGIIKKLAAPLYS